MIIDNIAKKMAKKPFFALLQGVLLLIYCSPSFASNGELGAYPAAAADEKLYTEKFASDSGDQITRSEYVDFDIQTGRKVQLRRIDKDAAGNVIKTHRYIFDSQGRVTTYVRANRAKNGMLSTINEYNFIIDPHSGVKIGYSREDRYPDGRVFNNFEYDYDREGKVTSYVKVTKDKNSSISAITEYVYRYDERTKKLMNHVCYRKDEDGRVTREDTYDYDPVTGKKIKYIRRDMDKNGNIYREDIYTFDNNDGRNKSYARVLRDSQGNIKTNYDYSYDGKGRVSKFTRTDKDKRGNIVMYSVSISAYDGSTGKKIRSVQKITDHENKTGQEITYLYDPDTGRKTEYRKKETNSRGMVENEDVYKYDPVSGHSRSYSKIIRDPGGRVVKTYEHTYDDAGKMAGYVQTNMDKNGQISSRHEFSYLYSPDSGKKVEYIIGEIDPDGTLLREDVYKYDKHTGAKTSYSRKDFTADGSVRRTREYIYGPGEEPLKYKKTEVSGDGDAMTEENSYQYDPETSKKIRHSRVVRDKSGYMVRENINEYDPETGIKLKHIYREWDKRGNRMDETIYSFDRGGRLAFYSAHSEDIKTKKIISSCDFEYRYEGESDRKTEYIRTERGESGELLRQDIYKYDPDTGMKKGYLKKEKSDKRDIFMVQELTYDSSGDLVLKKTREEDPSGRVLTAMEYKYYHDEPGGKRKYMTQVKRDGDGRVLSRDKYEYDTVSGQKIHHERERYDGTSGIVRRGKYDFNIDSGKKTSYYSVESDTVGNILKEDIYRYDDMERCVEHVLKEYDPSGELSSLEEYVFEFDPGRGGRTRSVHSIRDCSGRVLRRDISVFDTETGKKVCYIREDIDGKGNVLRHDKHSYDRESGKKTGYERMEKDISGKLTRDDKYVYDQEGRIRRFTKSNFDNNSMTGRTEYEYEYDHETGRKSGLVKTSIGNSGAVTGIDTYRFDAETGARTRYARISMDDSGNTVREEEFVYNPVTGNKMKYTRSDKNASGVELRHQEYRFSRQSGKKIKYSGIERGQDGRFIRHFEYIYDYNPATGERSGYSRIDKDENGNMINRFIYSYGDEGQIDFINSDPVDLTNNPDYDIEFVKNGTVKTVSFKLVDGVNDLTVRDTSTGEVYTFQVTLDTSAPLIDANPPEITNQGYFVLNYLADGIPRSKEFILEEGINELEIREKDAAGNEAVFSFRVVLDTVPPVIKASLPEATNKKMFNINYSVDDVEKLAEFPLQEGENYLGIYEIDEAGNESVYPFKITLDTDPPVIKADPVSISNDAIYTLEYSVDSGMKKKDFILEEGVNRLSIIEKDKAGNETAYGFEVILDTEAPVITADPPGATSVRDLSLVYHVDGREKKKQYILEEGENEIQLIETDEAGNSSVFSFMTILDTTPPRGIVKINGGAEVSRSNKVKILCDFADEGTGVREWRYKKDEGEWGGWDEYDPSGEETVIEFDNIHGQHTVFFEFKDKAGNVEEHHASVFLDLSASMGSVLIKVKDNIYKEGDICYVNGEKSFLKDLVDIIPQDGSGDYRVVFDLCNLRTEESRLITVKYPVSGDENIAYADTSGTIRDVFDGDEVLFKACIFDNNSGKTSNWSDPVIFCLDERGPDGSVAVNKGEKTTGKTKLVVEVFAMDEGSGISMWRSRVDDGEWSDWREYYLSEKEINVDIKPVPGEHHIDAEFMDKIGNIERSTASIIYKPETGVK